MCEIQSYGMNAKHEIYLKMFGLFKNFNFHIYFVYLDNIYDFFLHNHISLSNFIKKSF